VPGVVCTCAQDFIHLAGMASIAAPSLPPSFALSAEHRLFPF
jgi:hypothetical protein